MLLPLNMATNIQVHTHKLIEWYEPRRDERERKNKTLKSVRAREGNKFVRPFRAADGYSHFNQSRN